MSTTRKQTFFSSFKIAIVLLITLSEMCFGQSSWELINPLPQPLPIGQQFTSVIYGNGKFVVGGIYDTILTTFDGKTWTEINSQSFLSMTYGDSLSGGQPGMFMAVGELSTFLTSADGTTWLTNSTLIQGLDCVAYGKGRFIAVNNASNAFSISIDGKTWTKKYLAFNQSIYYVTYCNGQFVALDHANGIVTNLNLTPPDTSCFLTSIDGSSWTMQKINTYGIYPPLYSVTWGNRLPGSLDSQFVGVGMTGLILTSPDGAVWTKKLSGTTSWLHCVIFGNGQFVAVGDNGTILTSPDGTIWTKLNSGTTDNINSVTFANGLFMAVGDKGTILTSKADQTGIVLQQNVNPLLRSLKINLAKNHISAIVPNALSHSQLHVSLYNVSGKRIYSTVIVAQNGILAIPASGLSMGKYFMSIRDERNGIYNSSFVLTR